MSNGDEQEAPTRVCRKCSTQSTTSGDFCPHCGASFLARRRRPSKRVAIVAAVVVVLALAGGGVAFAMKAQSDAAAAEREQRAQDREAERLERQEASEQAADESEREYRATLVEELEKNITKSAKEAVETGVLEGPIKRSSCTATGGSIDDLTALTGTFSCIAVNKENDDGSANGFEYTGTVDWESAELQWQLGG